MSKHWERGFDAAKAAKNHSTCEKYSKQMGAALFSGSTLVSIGFNRYDRSHPESSKFSTATHAEHIAVIRRRYYNDKNLTMYVYREDSKCNPVMSKPCNNCVTIMKNIGVKRVRYYDEEGTQREIKL